MAALSSLLNPMVRKYFEDQLHALGNVVSGWFSCAMMSCALSSKLMFRSVMSLIRGDDMSPRFEARKVSLECEYKDCFLSLLQDGSLLLGVYRKFVDTEGERIAITNPVPTTVLNTDDVLVVLSRSDLYS